MSYIPQRLRFEDFPVNGVFGISDREALDLAIDGHLNAYYLISPPFELVGASMSDGNYMSGSYGDFHGPLAKLPRGMLSDLESNQRITFNKSTAIQVEGFYHPEFGPPAQPEAVRAAFDAEDFYWLLLKEDRQFEIDLRQVMFMRDDLREIAAARQVAEKKPLHPSERRSAAQIIAVLAALARLDLSGPYAAEKDLRTAAARLGLELPSSPETVVKFLKAAASPIDKA